MNKLIAKMAYEGSWDKLLPILRENPSLVNSTSESKGYTPLHQAAWHGSSLKIVRELLALGANNSLRTLSQNQTAQDIAKEKHPKRLDLEYVLAPGKRTLAQLLRKLKADVPDLFESYDGNQIVFDRLVEFFSSDFCFNAEEDPETRIDSAFKLITGFSILSSREILFEPCKHFKFRADTNFWKNRFLPALTALSSRACCIPIESAWAVVSDL